MYVFELIKMHTSHLLPDQEQPLCPLSMQRRPTIEDFLLHSSGRCGLTDVVDFLSDFVLKSEEDKKEFSKLVS